MFQLDYLNTCTPEAFAAALGDIFEHSPWVAQGAVAKRPFPTVTALHDAMMVVVRAAPADRQLAFVLAHPELGSKLGRAPILTDASKEEQGVSASTSCPTRSLSGSTALIPPTGSDLAFPSSSACGVTPAIRPAPVRAPRRTPQGP